MTPRQQHTPGGFSAALADLPQGQIGPGPVAPASTDGCTDMDCWEVLFSTLTSQPQRRLLDLARQQGLLEEYQLPSVCLSACRRSLANGNTHVQLLRRLLHGQSEALVPVRPVPVTLIDATLPAVQQEAVAAALASPDVCLLRSPPGATVAALVAEIVTQAAQSGQRVLLLGQSAVAIDAVLERLTGRDSIYAIRCWPASESLEKLSLPVRGLTFAERRRILRERSLECARQALAEVEDHLQQRPQTEQLWPVLLEIHARHEELQQMLQQLDHSLCSLKTRLHHPAEAIRDQSPCDLGIAADEALKPFECRLRDFDRPFQEERTRLEQHIAGLKQEQDKRRQELAELHSHIEQIQPLVAAREQGRWWSVGWWKATLRGKDLDQYTEWQDRELHLQTVLTDLERQLETAEQRRNEIEVQFQQQRDHLVAEMLRQHSEQSLAQQEAVQSEQRLLQEKWQQLASSLPVELPPLAASSLTELQDRQQAWQQHAAQAEEKQHFLKQWLAYLEEAGDALAERLPRLANLVAATVQDLARDEQFGDTQADPATFDLLILQGTQHFSDTQLLKLAGRARRWIFLGETHEETGSSMHAGMPRSRANCFQSLWRLLHCDPRELPYRWSRRGGRLHCQLRSCAPEQRRYLEREPVADRPEIELGILNMPRMEPVLAEVAFPADMPIAEAKRYIFLELQEVALQTTAQCLRWQEQEDRIVLHLSDPRPGLISLTLTDGIREGLHAETSASAGTSLGQTAHLEFERAAGWSCDSAREWVLQHLGWSDLGRTVSLF